MSLYTLAGGDHQRLVSLLRSSYTPGQLKPMYDDLLSNAPLGMSDQERTARTTAIQEILGITPVAPILTEPMSDNNLPTSTHTDRKLPLAIAQKFADNLVCLLEDYCDRIDIAGSIRRGKAEVKDIEIVCHAKLDQVPGAGLFDPPRQVITPGFRRTVERLLGKVIKGKYDGRYMMIELDSGLKLDLFMPQAEDYYRQLAIRTGSPEYSNKVIAVGWKKKGWCGTADGLRLISECEETATGWKCLVKRPTVPPVWQSEQEFFSWLGLKWIEPKNRT